MRKFLVRSSLLLSLVLGTLMVCEIVVRSMPNSYKQKNEYMLKYGDTVETLIFGSSHTYNGINPEFLEGRVYSLASFGQNLRYDYSLLSRYSDKYKNLKTVIVPISYFSFFSTPYDLEENTKHYITSYHIYMGCPFGSGTIRYNFELADGALFRKKLIACAKRTFMTCSPSGFNALKLVDKPKDQEKRFEFNEPKVKDWRYFNDNLNELVNIADFCKNHGVRLILITTPTYCTYYESCDTKQLNKMYSTINMIKKKYHLPYFDHLTDDRFVEEDFWDSGHLTDVGAEKFTKILNEEIKAIKE